MSNNNRMLEWIYTPIQVEKIKKHDMQAMLQFYNDNYKRLYKMACNYVRNHRDLGMWQYDVEDCLQQVLLDLPYLDYGAPSHITFDIKNKSFRCSVFGGLSYLIENKCGYSDTQRHHLDLISTDAFLIQDEDDEGFGSFSSFLAVPSFEDEILDPNKNFDTLLLDILKDILPCKQAEFLHLYFLGYTQAEIKRKLHCSGINFNQSLEKLKDNAQYIVQKFVENGCTIAEQYIGKNPNRKPIDKVYKNTDERRKKARDYMRQRRIMQKLALMQQPYTATSPLPY